MKMFSIILAWLVLIQVSYAQQSIQKLNVDQLKLPKESVSRATYIDASGVVRSSATIDDTELSQLNGASSNIQAQINSSNAAISTNTSNIGANTSAIANHETRITTLEGYDKVLEYVNLAGFPVTGATATLYLDKALNKLYRWNGSAYTLVGDGTGTGDVVGPASATDTAIAIYDGTTGKLIKNSVVTINSSGDVSANSISAPLTSTTSTLSGVILNNSTVKAVSGANIDLDTVTATNSINLKKKTTFWGRKNHVTVDDTATGSNVTLADHAVSVVRLTGSGLVSVDGIPAGNGADTRTIINMTGADIFLNNDTGATAANRFYTGTGSNLKVKNNSAVQVTYDTTNQRWYVTSGAGAGGISPWATATSYKTGDVIYTNDKIYVALADHTSGTFSSDLGTSKWKRLSDQFTVSNETGTQQTIRDLRFPKNQVTQVSSDIAMVESGNRNRLVNPGFEHQTPTTGWTSASTGTATLSTTANALTPINGWGTSMTLGCVGGASGGTCSFYQDVSTSKKRQFVVGLDLISDTASGVKVYSRVDGANNKSLSIKDTILEFRKIPEMSGTTSTGVLVEITVAASQSILVQVDDANVGVADFRQDMSTIGPWIDYGAMTIGATTTAPTKATTREKDSVRCRVVGQDYECLYEYRAASATGSAVGSGGYIFNLPSGVAIDTTYQYTTTNRTTFNNYDGLRAAASIGFGDVEYTGNGDTGGKCDVYATSSTTFQANCFFGGLNNWMISSSDAPVINQANAGFKFQVRFRGAGLSATSSSYMTQNSNTGYLDCGLTSSAFTAFGTVTNIALQCRRRGEELDIKGKFTSTSPAASEARLALPLWSGNSFGTGTQLVSKGTQFIPSTQIAGAASLAAVGDQSPTILIDPSTAYVNFGFQGASGAGLTKQTGSGWLGGAGTTVSIKASIPIEGWDETNFAIANISGLESCSNSAQCETEYYADISATGVVSGEEIEFINGNCALATNTFSCTYTTAFTQAATCKITPGAGATQVQKITETTTGFSYSLYNSGGTLVNVAASVSCRKRGVDYVTKTARAVAGDQNLAVPGFTKAKACYYAFGGASATLASPTKCTTGTCTEVIDTCGTASPPVYNGGGSAATYGPLTFASGTFAPNAYVDCTCSAYDTATASVKDCRWAFTTGNNSWSANSSGGFTIGYIYSTIPAGAANTASDAFVTVKCEGQGP